jgi:hypothetical protein
MKDSQVELLKKYHSSSHVDSLLSSPTKLNKRALHNMLMDAQATEKYIDRRIKAIKQKMLKKEPLGIIKLDFFVSKDKNKFYV